MFFEQNGSLCSFYNITQVKLYLIEYLQWNLQYVLEHFHHVLDLQPPQGGWNVYDYQALVEDKILVVLGLVGCRGHDDDVAFVVGDRRQSRDLGPQGIAIRTGPLYVHLTRACKRTHWIDMDLSREMILPSSTKHPLTVEGMSLGLARSQCTESGRPADSVLRRQLNLVRLKKESEFALRDRQSDISLCCANGLASV